MSRLQTKAWPVEVNGAAKIWQVFTDRIEQTAPSKLNKIPRKTLNGQIYPES